MSSCSNCFNGCTETTSDQCIKYTGIDVPELGISHGDPLSSIEESIINFLVPTLDGTGIKPIIQNSYICDVVRGYLPACTDCTGFTLNEVLTAIIRATCDIQTQVDENTATLVELNSDYNLSAGCLSNVTNSSDTHLVLQAVIDRLCTLNSSFSALLLSLPNTYVPQSQINTYIQAYLNSQNFLALAKDRMIPYAAIPYFGPLSGYPTVADNFSLTGQGTGYWQKVYLCNGLNGTPDLRGRTLVGVTTGMGGAAFDIGSPVNPATPGIPNYTISPTTGLPITEYGENIVTLNISQIPNHNHPTSTVAITDPGHFHYIANYTDDSATGLLNTNYMNHYHGGDNSSYFLRGSSDEAVAGKTSSEPTGITATPTIAAQGSGNSHNNVQPSRASFYIMYIP
jgi:microcystin-dependent protein